MNCNEKSVSEWSENLHFYLAIFLHFTVSDNINLVLVSRNEEKLLQKKEELQEKYSIYVEIIACDLTSNEAVENIINTLSDKQIHIDYLVNNAGFNEVGEFLQTNLVNEMNIIQLHISFVTKLTKCLLPDMVKNKYGHILNIASTGAYIPCPNNTVYTATKAYILFFSKGLSAELSNSGVTVTATCPGATKTLFAEKAKIDKSLLFKFFVMDSKDVARKCFKAMMKGKKVEVVGLYNKLLVTSSIILPGSLVNKISKKMMA